MKFNTKNEGLRKTTNYMGEDAYVLHDEERLLNLCATCMWGEPKYYGGDKVYVDILALAEKVDPEFVLQLAWYLRTELYLRTVPLVLIAAVAHRDDIRGIKTTLLRAYVPEILQRADEMSEVLAAYNALYAQGKDGRRSKPIPNGLKKAVRDVFESGKFNEYHLAKNNSGGKVKHRDVIAITHPSKPQELIKKVISDTLETPYTWEVEISKHGNKAWVWHNLIDNKALGYMATIRNLVNMVKAGIDEPHAMDVASFIVNKNAIINSKQFPFRFVSAHEELEKLDINKLDVPEATVFESDRGKLTRGFAVALFKKALNEAVEISARNNIPKFEGNTVIICDNSGSATGDFGGRSNISVNSVRSMADAGNMLGILAWYASENTMFGVFGDKLIMLQLDRDEGLLDNFKTVKSRSQLVGGSTEQGVFTMLAWMIKNNIHVDRLIVCSDLQIGDGKDVEYGTGRTKDWIILPDGKSIEIETGTRRAKFGSGQTVPELVNQYRKTVNPKMWYHSVCFNGYGTNIIEGARTSLTQGWSDKIFTYLKTVEEDKGTQLKYIKTIYAKTPQNL